MDPSKIESNSWRMFRIMGEFAAGFQTLNEIPKAIAIFGSARTNTAHPHYLAAEQIAASAVKLGYPVITGGGPGIMEAGNKGAKSAKGTSVGLCINLPMEQHSNPFINVEVKFHYFFVRKVMFLKHTCAVVVMPVSVDGMEAGTIGLLGPTRMNYPQALAAARVVGEGLSRRLGESGR